MRRLRLTFQRLGWLPLLTSEVRVDCRASFQGRTAGLLGALTLLGGWHACGEVSGTAQETAAAPTTEISAEDEEFFESKVRPLLTARCVECHAGSTAEGGLSLDTREGWQRGGEHGPAIMPQDPEGSRLMAAVRRLEGQSAMPPDESLSADEIAVLATWIRRGAPDPREQDASRLGGLTREEAKHWWSFQPLRFSAVPELSGPADSQLSPIDAYLSLHASRMGVVAETEADRRTLLRRVSFDLTGLAPDPAELDRFVGDQRPDAWERQVDRLLASHAYAERSARHWLDVVRYADTAGENSDHPLPHAWRYRNWVVDALGQDLSVDDFFRWQLAGDLIAQEAGPAFDESERGGPITATGYLAIARRFGHDIDQDMHLTYEDVIDTLGKSMLGLTLGCARCHAHKYDPVSAEDYYALYGIFASTKFSFPGCEPRQMPDFLVPIVDEASWRVRHGDLEAERRVLRERLAELERIEAESLGVMRDESRRTLTAEGAIDQAKSTTWGPEGSNAEHLAATVSVKAGDALLLIVDPRGNHGADTTRVSWRIESTGGDQSWDLTTSVLDDLLQGNPHRESDGSGWLFLDGATWKLLAEPVQSLDGNEGFDVWRTSDTPSFFVNRRAEPIRVWTTLEARTTYLHPGQSGPVIVGWIAPSDGQLQHSGSIADGHPEGGDGVGFRIVHVPLEGVKVVDALERIGREGGALRNRISELDRAIPPRPVAYAVQEGKPADVAVQIKGEPQHLGDVVSRRWLEVLGGETLGHEQTSGRRELAERLVPSKQPLAARVLVNRLWLQHFGRGLVRTPNDFGTRGEPPTHPELLDRLASELIAGDSIKRLHRMMVTTHAYRRRERPASEDRSLDPNRESYAGFERRRLSAEELRDTLLQVAGDLDGRPGREHPFPPESTWSFTQHGPFAESYPHSKRSLYLMVKRNRREPFLALFDGADPSATTPVRQSTIVPTQALFFMNDPFFHERAASLAARTREVRGFEDRLAAILRLTLQRAPNDIDREVAIELLSHWPAGAAPVSVPVESSEAIANEYPEAAWEAVCRVVLGSNEFLFVD